MSDEEAKKDYDVAVNGTPHTLEHEQIGFEKVVELAYPGQAGDEKYIFKVEYENAKSEPHDGKLVKGEHVEVRHTGTEFSVLRSVRS